MNLLKTTIKVGAEKPFKVLHLSDTHLTLANEFDDARKHQLAKDRPACFPEPEATLEFASTYAKEHSLPILHTGDLIDFVSHANLERARQFTDENDVFLAAGNHEFSQYVGEAWEDAEYRNQSLGKVQAAFKNDIRFSKREIGGVNFVALDNSYYLVEWEQLDKLKAVVAEGKPVVLMMHNPVYTPALFEYQMTKPDGGIGYVMGAPEELIRGYSEHRYRQQKADEPTMAAYNYILSEKAIKALIVGHLHVDREDAVTDTLTQYMVACDTVREITFE